MKKYSKKLKNKTNKFSYIVNKSTCLLKGPFIWKKKKKNIKLKLKLNRLEKNDAVKNLEEQNKKLLVKN